MIAAACRAMQLGVEKLPILLVSNRHKVPIENRRNPLKIHVDDSVYPSQNRGVGRTHEPRR
jgi:hypothetical protein